LSASRGHTVTSMKIGDRVKHKLSGELFTIKRIDKPIAILRRDKPEITRFNDEVFTAIARLDNLELIESTNQLSLV